MKFLDFGFAGIPEGYWCFRADLSKDKALVEAWGDYAGQTALCFELCLYKIRFRIIVTKELK